jgi:hypothetical protein
VGRVSVQPEWLTPAYWIDFDIAPAGWIPRAPIGISLVTPASPP